LVPVRLVAVLLISIGAVLFVCGCPPETYPNVVPATLAEINPIVDSTTLTSQQQRLQLAALGLVPETINALLRSERTGNQYGGDLRTAYEKVIVPNFELLTPDEVQIYGDGASEADPNLSFSLTDSQAQAIVTLFADNALRTPDELSTFLADPATVLPTTIPDNTLTPLFVEFDPNLLLPFLP
jgi:hypothetical protein